MPTAFHALRAAANAKQPDAPNVQKTGTQAAFPGGVRFSDYLGLGVIAQVFPLGSIEAALGACGVRSVRRRDLPLEAMAYCVIAMGLFRQVSTREVLRCLADGLRLVAPGVPVRISGKSSISRARSRLGTAPSEGAAGPASGNGNAGGARVAGRPGSRGVRAFAGGGAARASGAGNAAPGRPRPIRLSLVVEGFGDRSRSAPARARTRACIRRASRSRTGRGRPNCGVRDWTAGGAAVPAGSGSWNVGSRRRFSTPARELAGLYHERWEIENACDEVKTHLLGPGAALRSKTPDLVLREIDGLMLAHCAVRSLIRRAAGKAREDPDGISSAHAVRVARRRLQNPDAVSP